MPSIRDEREAAAVLESNSPLDHPEQWVESEEVKAERPLSHILAVRLDARTIDRLATLARRKGIGPSTLARMWLLERLAELEEAQERAGGPAPKR